MDSSLNYTQIILELKKDSFYKPSSITKCLSDIFPDLGNELILPINTENEESENIPIFIFQQNPKFKISGNYFDVTIVAYDEYREKIDNILKHVFKIFEKEAKFYAIAFTFQEQLDKELINQFENAFFKNNILQKQDEIHLALNRYIKINDKDVQCVEGYSTINNNFISHFEFHFKRSNYDELSYKTVSQLKEKVMNYKKDKEFK